MLIILISIYILSTILCVGYSYITENGKDYPSIKAFIKNCPTVYFIPIINTVWVSGFLFVEIICCWEPILDFILNKISKKK
jgi:hypothetical protein